MDNTITLITLSGKKAAEVLTVLRDNGLNCRLATSSCASDGYADIEVNATQMKEAISIIESMLALPVQTAGKGQGNVLIPVDLSEKSIMGCKVGLELANRLGTGAVLLHAYVSAPIQQGIAPFQSIDAPMADEVQEVENEVAVSKLEEKALRKFTAKIKDMQAHGEMDNVPLTSVLREGMPEDVIRDMSRDSKPKAIVMTTRNNHHKAQDLVGSVTAEVLDSCQAPLLSVPEDCNFPGIRAIRQLVFFCHLDRQDIVSMETFLRLFEYPQAEISLVCVSNKNKSASQNKLESLQRLFSDCYPSVKFQNKFFSESEFKSDFKGFVDQTGAELLIVQNKKKNIFARLVNPGIAHILFYERDMPMLVLPVQ